MRPFPPESWVPLTYRELQDDLSEALADHIERKKLTAGEIAKRWPTCRDGHLKALRNPNMSPLGLKMLIALAEATGLRVKLEVSP